MNNLYFPICAVLINILIFIVFYSKKRYESEETKAYSYLIIIALFESILASILVVLMNKFGKPVYIYYLHRIDYILMLLWVWALFDYVSIVSIDNNSILRKVVKKGAMFLNILASISFFFLDVNVINENGVIDTNGPAMNVLFACLAVYIILIVIMVIKTLSKNIKSVNNRKFLPLLFLSILGILGITIRSIAPEILFVSLIAAYADLIMFFTIENPDVKMIYELNKNKKLVESMTEEKSNFLFSITQDIRKPIENIINVNNIIIKEEDMDTIKNGIKIIDNNARSLTSVINNVLDVSSIDSNKLMASKETYNFNSIILMCIKNLEEKVNSDVKIRTNISKNIPHELYGDSVKLKQVITSIAFNAAKYTKKGFIDIDVNEIVKYDVCRLIISIEDTGMGMTPQKLNELLRSSNNLEDTDLIKLDNLDVDLKLTFKLIKKLGGYINIKSEEKKGSTFTIVLDQKIKKEEDTYNKYMFNKKKVIAVSDKLKMLKDLDKLSSKYNIEYMYTMFSNDLVGRIKDGESFDLVLLEDDMKPNSALAVLGKLQEAVVGYKIPTVVMLNDDKDKIKRHYLEDGFDDYIMKTNIEEELDKVIKKYI